MKNIDTPNKKASVIIIIPNWNGADELAQSIDSVLAQTFRDFKLLIVDNGSVDESLVMIAGYQKKDARILLRKHSTNLGYTGGVNPGLTMAIKENYEFAVPFNNDAIADKKWLEILVDFLRTNPGYGAAACSLQSIDGDHYDSTGDIYTTWGLPYPRGRGEKVQHQYDQSTEIFGASGGASAYRVKALKEVGILDDDFFAYYEDVDMSFRLQLNGWKVGYLPTSIVYHAYNTTSSKIKGFTTYQTIKNLPWVLVKNVPARLFAGVAIRFSLAYAMFIGRAFMRGQGWWAIKAYFKMLSLIPKKIGERRKIQTHRKVDSEYISSIMTHDLPPNAHNLRVLRKVFTFGIIK
jgi:GT2 family glycosyltransferase